MRTSHFCGFTFGVCAAVMLAGCAGGDVPQEAVTSAQGDHSVRPAYDVVYSFKGGRRDGADPFAGLIDVKGTLYGTTAGGGGNSGGNGTVFSITQSGKETIRYAFKGMPSDGQQPGAPLVNVSGTLYGTTVYGGANGEGTVFAITPAGKETVLHSFGGSGTDGYGPNAVLVNINGTLYGTTTGGGAHDCNGPYCGTVFALTTSGKETLLYSFKGSPGDGEDPEAGLINIDGVLYGTTALGGARDYGTVFSISPSGAEAVVHSFLGRDGKYPLATLINVNGSLYGTTSKGGASNFGTVFSTATSGKERVLYSFAGESGAKPYAHLLNMNGTLYGTTSMGGANNRGTVFSLTASGTETVLHSFGGSEDGETPYAALLNVKGTIYGTTRGGGANDDGTIFSLSP